MQLPDTYSDMSFISCSYAFLRIYSQRSLSLFGRDWTYCRSLVCTGHVARESTYLRGGEETKRFYGYLQCKSYDNDDDIYKGILSSFDQQLYSLTELCHTETDM